MTVREQPAPDPERPLLAEVRRAEISERLRTAGSVTVSELETQYGISSMTARRDLAAIERQGLARRTHGGAMLPSIAAHEDSFASRLAIATDSKRALAAAAAATVAPGESLLLDSSSTAYHVARELLDAGIAATIITNSLPIMQLVATSPQSSIELLGVGGTLRRLTGSFVGPFAVHTIRGHFADRCFFSVKGVTADGSLTDPDALEAEVKRELIAHAGESVLLVDQTKLAVRGLNVIARVADLGAVLVEQASDHDLAPLRAPGVRLEVVAVHA